MEKYYEKKLEYLDESGICSIKPSDGNLQYSEGLSIMGIKNAELKDQVFNSSNSIEFE